MELNGQLIHKQNCKQMLALSRPQVDPEMAKDTRKMICLLLKFL